MNKNCKKIVNAIFVCITLLVFFAGLFRTVFFPKDINDYENRSSNKIISINITSFLDGSFQDSIDNALADQIPKAQGLKKLYNDTLSNYIGFLLRPIIKSNDHNYINYKGTLIFDSQYVYQTFDLDAIKSSLKSRAKNYNTLFEKYPDIDYYVYYIEKDTDINFENNEKINVDEYFFSLLNLEESKKMSFEIEDFKNFQKYFYKTDHHWNHIGSYKAYTEILEFIGCVSKPIEPTKEVLISKRFMGSKAAKAGSSFLKETFSVYEFDFSPMSIVSNGEQVEDYGMQKEYILGAVEKDVSYGGFYGGDRGETIFDSGATELDNILIIGESYDNAILKLLVPNFNRIHSIDLRNYEKEVGKKFQFGQYIEDNDIDKVLFIGNGGFYFENEFKVESN